VPKLHSSLNLSWLASHVMSVLCCREVVRLYGDTWNSKKRIGDVAGARAASRWQRRWPVVKRIIWETRNGGSQLAAAQALDQRWQAEREARPGNFTLTSFVTLLRVRTSAMLTTTSARMASPSVARGLKHLRRSAARVSAGNDRKVWQLASRLLYASSMPQK
jgi:hypothetical protein